MIVPAAFEACLQRLVDALHGLRDGQGRIARRNARTRVRQQLRRMQAKVDDLYPGQRKPAKRAPKPTTPAGRSRRNRTRQSRMFAAGWYLIPTGASFYEGISILEFYAEAAAAGIRARKIDDTVWMPAWAWWGWRKRLPIAHLKKNLAARKALLATVALENSQ